MFHIPFKKKSAAIQASILLLGAGVFLPVAQNIFAQVPDAGALQQQLQREADRANIAPPPENLIKKKERVPAPAKGSESIDVSTFTIVGVTLISQEAAKAAVAPYENQKLSFDQIKQAADAVTALYSQAGRVAQAVIPPQNVVNGVITIKIIEGKVGKTQIELNKEAPSRFKPELMQDYIYQNNAPGAFIDLNGLERSLALLNEIPGNEVDGQLAPGASEETTDIVVNAKDAGWYSGRVEASNYGASNTGNAQGLANLNVNNLTGYGDQLQLDAIGSAGSLFGQLRYGVPVGSDGWKVSVGTSALNYNSLSSFSSTSTSGNAQTYGIYTLYALERTPQNNTNIIINYEIKNYLNNTNGIQSSNYKLNDLTIGLNGNRYLGGNYLNWGVNAVLGNLNISNTTQLVNDTNGAATNGSFGKLTFNASLTMPLPINRTVFVTSFNGQLANKNLNSAEQIYMGGPYAIRAYPVAQGGGSQGAILSLELNHTYENNLQLGAFIDAGLVQQYVNLYNNWQGQTNASNTYSLYATGLTGKYSYEKFQLNATLAFRLGQNPLYNQSGQQLNVDNRYNTVQGWVKGTYFF